MSYISITNRKIRAVNSDKNKKSERFGSLLELKIVWKFQNRLKFGVG